jgi:hypothetical protein
VALHRVIRKKTQGVTENAAFGEPKNPDETFKNRNRAGFSKDERPLSEDEAFLRRDDSCGGDAGKA